MKTKIFLTIIVGIVIGLVMLKQLPGPSNQSLAVVYLNHHRLELEVADSPATRDKGLSGREKLEKGKGMLFIFEKADRYPFWMQEMKFNLDFVFVNGEQVVDIKENIPYPQPGEKPVVILANEPFDKVLELPTGTIQNDQIKVGDLVKNQP